MRRRKEFLLKPDPSPSLNLSRACLITLQVLCRWKTPEFKMFWELTSSQWAAKSVCKSRQFVCSILMLHQYPNPKKSCFIFTSMKYAWHKVHHFCRPKCLVCPECCISVTAVCLQNIFLILKSHLMLVTSQPLPDAHSTIATANSLSSATDLFFIFQINRLIQQVAFVRLVSPRIACIYVCIGWNMKYLFLFMAGSYSTECINYPFIGWQRFNRNMCIWALVKRAAMIILLRLFWGDAHVGNHRGRIMESDTAFLFAELAPILFIVCMYACVCMHVYVHLDCKGSSFSRSLLTLVIFILWLADGPCLTLR